MKKTVKRIVVCVLAVILSSIACISAFAENVAEIYSESFAVNSGENVTIPVYIKNNPGIMGYKITVEYDENVFVPVSISRGDAFSGGMFIDNIDVSHDGSFLVLWSNTSNCFDNGLLFLIEFQTNQNAKGKHVINISSSDDDTFNESWQTVKIKSNSSTIDFGGENTEVSFFQRIVIVIKRIWSVILDFFGRNVIVK